MRAIYWLVPSWFILCLTQLTAANWPQFRGPDSLGISAESVPVRWSSTENMKWKTELPGRGSSSPIIWEEAVIVTSFTGEGPAVERQISRYDLGTGELRWTRTIPPDFTEDPAEGYIMDHGWASSTPVTDGELVYGFFGKAGVYAFDLEGNEVWKTETGPMSSRQTWGSASSPILYRDILIVPAGDELRAFLALDKKTGKEKWRAEGDSLMQTYGTPVLVEVNENRTDLVYAGTAEWWGLNPDTGKLRWFAEYNLPGNMSNTTHRSGDILTISGGFPRTARVALRVGAEGDVSSKILYDTQKPATYMTMPVEHEGVLYWVSDSGIAFAANPGEAEELWQERLPELRSEEARGRPVYASPVLAGGKIYAFTRTGGAFVIQPDPEKLNILARNWIENDTSAFNATPAVSGGMLVVRSQTHLYGIGK